MSNQYEKPGTHYPTRSQISSDQIIGYIISAIIILFFTGRAILGAIQTRNTPVKPEPAGYTFFNMGNHSYELGDYTKAIEQYNIAIGMSPDFGEAYNNRGLVYFDQGEYNEAWIDFDKAVQLMPGSATPYNNRGAAYLAKGNTNAGLSDFNEAIEIEKEFAKAYYNRGLAYLDLNNTDQAIVDFTKAIEYTPEWVTEILKGKPTSAATGETRRQAGFTSFIDFIQSYADLPLVYTQRGYAYLIEGEFNLAVADLKKAQELGPDPETKEEVEMFLFMAQSQQIGATRTKAGIENEGFIPTETAEWDLKQETIVPTMAQVGKIYIRSLAINPAVPGIIYAGTDSKSMRSAGSIFISNNGGVSWSTSDSGLVNRDVWALAIDPQKPTTIYAGTRGEGLFKSTDGGANWKDINSSLTEYKTITSLAIDPANPSTIYAGGGNSLFKSGDGGETWEFVDMGLWNPNLQVLAIDPLTTSTIYGGGNGLFMSTNFGMNWELINSSLISSGLIDVYGLAIDPITPTTVYVGAWDGYSPSGGSIYKSTDSVQSILEINSGLPSAIVFSIAVDPINPVNIYIGTAKGLFKSANGGESWSEIDPTLSDTIITAVVIDPLTPTTIFAGTYGHGVIVYHRVDEK